MKQILVIEDNAVAANLYRTTLVSAGYDVSVATDGESGLAAAAQRLPDLVLLDLMLPKIAGLEVLRKIRATPALAQVPVMVTSNAYTGRASTNCGAPAPRRSSPRPRSLRRNSRRSSTTRLGSDPNVR